MAKLENCHLWKNAKLTKEDISLEKFDIVERFVDESHLNRRLIKCKDCGQLFFYEFYEEIDWKDGNDPQYTTFIPVENEEEAKKMADKLPIELLQLSPRLQDDWSSDAKKSIIHWVGKN